MNVSNGFEVAKDTLLALAPAHSALFVLTGSKLFLNAFEDFDNIFVIEADFDAFKRHQDFLGKSGSKRVLNQVVSDYIGRGHYYTFSEAALNGHKDVRSSQNIFSDVELLSDKEMDVVTASSVLSENEFQASWVFIDALSPSSIVRGLADTLKTVSIVVLRELDFSPSLPILNMEAEMDCFGFRKISSFDCGVDGVRASIYSNLADCNCGSEKILPKASCLEKENAILNRRLSELTEKYEQLRSQKQKTDLMYELTVEERSLNESRVFDLASKVLRDELDVVFRRFSNLHSKRINSDLLYHTKHIESFISLQNLFIHNESPISFTGWPLSSDSAFFLAQKMLVGRYDLVIEFGSGSSTAMLAKIISLDSYSGEVSTGRHIISFEHENLYYSRTSQLLRMHKVEGIVDLILSPLARYDQDHKFYSCSQALREASAAGFDPESRVLIVVDGPPGQTNPMARFPALPVVLECFSECELHFFLDDYRREDEKEVLRKWANLLDGCGRAYTTEVYEEGKGFGYLVVASPLLEI